MTGISSAIELDWKQRAMRSADQQVVRRQFDFSASACTLPLQKTPGTAGIRAATGDISFAEQSLPFFLRLNQGDKMPFVTEPTTLNRRQNTRGSDRRESAPFKVLNGSFVFPGRSFCFERAQVPSLSRPRVIPSRIQTIVARPKFSDHINSSSFVNCRLCTMPVQLLAVVERVKKQAGRADIATIFDCIDASEGRLAFAGT